MKRRIILSVGICLCIYTNTAGKPAVFAEEGVKEIQIRYEERVLEGKGIEFSDLEGYEWAIPAIEEMQERGVVSGIGEGRYAPGKEVSRVEFASMAIRAVGGGGTEAIETLSNGAGNIEEIRGINGDYWGNETICASQYLGLTQYFGLDKGSWSKAATRAEMAYIIMTVAEKSGEEEFEIKEGIERNIGDYEEVKKEVNYSRAILKAYSNGIISGMDSKGNFAPRSNARRAEAAVMMWRLLDSSKRAVVEVKEPEVQQPVQPGENVGETGAVYPVEGEMGPDGKPITRDSLTGILGYGNGQKGGIYLGVSYPNGNKIGIGSDACDTYGTMRAGDTYSERNGYIYWSTEWGIIDNTIKRQLKETNPPDSNSVGLQADIEGNIIQPGSEAVAMYEIKDFMGTKMWQPLR